MSAACTLSQDIGKKAACEALSVPRATFYRHMSPESPQEEKSRPAPVLALTAQEKKAVIEVLHSERFQDKAPRQVYATLLDEGEYCCSVRTMYRILDEVHGDVKERRRHVERPHYEKPELLATAPNQVWSWDISVLQQRERRVVMT
jgi:putative transposase